MIILKSYWEIEKIRKSCAIVMEILLEIKTCVKPGVKANELEEIAENMLKKKNATPAFKGYKGYPYCLCTSLNNEVVHGMPLKGKVLKEGDVLSIDFGVLYDGYYGDAAITVPVGKVSNDSQRLIQVTEEALFKGIENARVGLRVGDISSAIQEHVEKNGFSVVRDFVGHGIGRELHEDPQIPNFGRKGSGVEIVPGMVLAIEPMTNAGGYEVKVLDDGWTVVTKDNSISAHFEHCIAITNNDTILLSKI
jgi:methionyl aminopeptidase